MPSRTIYVAGNGHQDMRNLQPRELGKDSTVSRLKGAYIVGLCACTTLDRALCNDAPPMALIVIVALDA